ncbi:MAG: phosphoribosylglycinamide formyltransferase [Bacteroidales bacterium]|nr:phosphoribosylglycinamide formyltransferase [Bacteroidales bacterium]
MQRIAIFASGSGTNAENLIKTYKNTEISVVRIFCNNENAGVLERAKRLQIPVTLFKKADLWDDKVIYNALISEKIDCIVLAGFMMLLPQNIIDAYRDKIVNIHPSLLPKYGGKGMYGHHVHEAVLANDEKESGITIHLVNEIYDSGEILFQAKCPVLENDTPDSLATRVHALEYEYYPKVVADYIKTL